MSDIYTDDEHTPPEVFEPVLESLGIEAFDTDPCSHPKALVPARIKHFGPIFGASDGLYADWHGIVWDNPPYSNNKPWIHKSARHASVMLLKFDPSTSIWPAVIWPQATMVLSIDKRVQFINPATPGRRATAKWASALVFFNLIPKLGPLRALGTPVIPVQPKGPTP